MPDADRGSAQELAALQPETRAVTIAGRRVEISEVTLAQGGRIIAAGWPLYELARSREIDMLELFDAQAEEVTAVIVAATGLEHEWVTSLQPVDKLALANAWMKVNGAFFVRRLLPELSSFMHSMLLIGGGGPTSSTSSPSTGT